MAQMIIPRADGSTAIVLGRVAILKVGKSKVRFFIHDGTLSHFASGHRFGSLNDIKVRNMCALGHHARLSDRDAAVALIDRTIARVGSAEQVLAVINAAPVINP
jgi:hypothetical protein